MNRVFCYHRCSGLLCAPISTCSAGPGYYCRRWHQRKQCTSTGPAAGVTTGIAGITIVGDTTSTGSITGASLSDGVASLTGGALTGATDITASGTVTGGTVTDGVASLTGGALTGVTTITASGLITGTGGANITGGTTTDTLDVTSDASVGGDLNVAGDTSIEGDLSVAGDASVSGTLSTNGIDNNFAGITNAGRISGVSDGIAPDDAVNVRQLDAQDTSLSAGIASIAALAAIPGPNACKMYSAGVGYGHYNGQDAFAVGLKANLPKSNISLAAGAGFSNNSSPAINAGASLSF